MVISLKSQWILQPLLKNLPNIVCHTIKILYGLFMRVMMIQIYLMVLKGRELGY